MNNLSNSLKCKVMSWNLLSLLNENNLSTFLQTLEDNNIQIACICETWLNAKNGKFTSTIKDSGYEIIHAYRENKRGGGTAILYKKTLKVKQGEASSSEFSSFEYCYIRLLSSKSKIVLACIY